MEITLGNSKVTAKSDGGISFYPESSAKPAYPIFCIEVVFPSRFAVSCQSSVRLILFCSSECADCRRNARNLVTATLKPRITCTLHKSMLNYWDKYVIANNIWAIYKASKRYLPTCSHLNSLSPYFRERLCYLGLLFGSAISDGINCE